MFPYTEIITVAKREPAAFPKWRALPPEIQSMIWRWAVRPTHLTIFCTFDQAMLSDTDLTSEFTRQWLAEWDSHLLGEGNARRFGCVKRDGTTVAYFVGNPPPAYRVCYESCAVLRRYYSLHQATPPGTTTTTEDRDEMEPPSALEAALPPWFDLGNDVVQLLYHDIEGIFTTGAPLNGLLRPVRRLRISMHRSFWQRTEVLFDDLIVSPERLLVVMCRIRHHMPNLEEITFVVAGRGPAPWWASRTSVSVLHWFDVFETWCGGGPVGSGPLAPPASSLRVVARHADGTEDEWMNRDNFLRVMQKQLIKVMSSVPKPHGLGMLEWARLGNYYPKYRDLLRATEQELANPAAFYAAHAALWLPPNLHPPFW